MIRSSKRERFVKIRSSDKDRIVALILCYFLGFLGVHRFYVGKASSGIVQMLTLGGLGIWVMIDLISIFCGAFQDKEGRFLRK